ncbi:MAG: 16S rRNA (uracil(1498)-N(3))-methyltransferase [Saprospiraceae bacterium]|nr:16S rRNA (uracil(1498)-N(3))-methyltransferase [Saprospiraceae bacterium]
MSLFYCRVIDENTVVLDEEESRHAIKVLRLGQGDTIEVTSGLGDLVKAQISDVGKRNVILQILSKTIVPKYSEVKRAIAIAPTKSNDRTEWFLEKAIEIGIDEIFFIQTSRSERPRINMERLHKIAVTAMKQSKNLYLPNIHTLKSIKEVLEIPYANRFVAHCMGPVSHLKEHAPFIDSALVFIGPEGDFTPEEVVTLESRNVKPVSLGPSRLRTETAGVYATAVLNLF